ncbi:hypothetical protein [Mesorhizobium escarrei]|uniref:Uncharacterized protein n=1 Tax=Mesorhizobium escarrei TaxID=666018 RepID=A0ABM9E573_9HYPH|nr:hypothetical protein [Mesorhizobium escarrei]CAH2404239.1 hypothetical protein MES5069_400183 [Mesorhizobium escarrei]
MAALIAALRKSYGQTASKAPQKAADANEPAFPGEGSLSTLQSKGPRQQLAEVTGANPINRNVDVALSPKGTFKVS